jgi:predicted DsbA family dithiol-disulfide isomerase
MSLVSLHYFTDPACPWSWALEPAVRRLLAEFGESLRVEYVMAGMAREFGDPHVRVREHLEAGLASGMPVDPTIWWQAAPRSSYPACIAVKAAAEQGDPGPYLRRLREAVMTGRRRSDTPDALLDEARALVGLDVERLRIDLSSHALLEAFGADLERARGVAAEHHAPASGRVRLPSLEFRGNDGVVHGVYGARDYATLRRAAIEAGAQAAAGGPPELEEALQRWGSMATVEVAEVCRLPGPRAAAALWVAATEWRVQARRAGTAELWSLA